MSGVFDPGSALLTRELLARYGCGISPLREAISRLVGEGMLAASGHRGVRVPLPSVSDLNELYRIRTLLECDALKLAMERGDDQWEAQIVAACYRLERAALPQAGTARGETVIEWEKRHRAFHATLIEAAAAPRLLRMIGQLVDQTERYRAIRLTKVDNTIACARRVGGASRARRYCRRPRYPRARPACRASRSHARFRGAGAGRHRVIREARLKSPRRVLSASLRSRPAASFCRTTA